MKDYLVYGVNELHRDIRLIHRFTGIDARTRADNIVKVLKKRYPKHHFWSQIDPQTKK